MATDSSSVKADIIERLDVVAEYRQLGVRTSGNVRENGFIACFSAFREEKKPSAYINTKDGFYGDSGRSESYSLFDFAVKQGRFSSFSEALKYYAEQVGVDYKPAPKAQAWEKRLELLEWDDLKYGLVRMWCQKAKPGITLESILRAGGRVGNYRGQKGTANPIQVIAIPGWKANKIKEENPHYWSIWKLGAGQGGEFTGGHKMLSTASSSDIILGKEGRDRLLSGDYRYVVKTAGPGDMLAQMAACPNDAKGYAIISNADGEDKAPGKGTVKLLADSDVVLIHDQDKAGDEGAKLWMLNLRCNHLRRVVLPYELADKHGKDLRDYYNDGHTYSDWVNLVKNPEFYEDVDTEKLVEKEVDDAGKQEEAFLEQLGIMVLGKRNSAGNVGINIYSHHTKQITPVRHAPSLTYHDLVACCGKNIIIKVSPPGEDDARTPFLKVKEAILIVAACRAVTARMIGAGVWEMPDKQSVIYVGARCAYEWNGGLKKWSVPWVRGSILDFPAEEQGWLDDRVIEYLESCRDPRVRRQIFEDLRFHVGKWRWEQPCMVDIAASLILVTITQTVWDWRPLVSLTGRANSGKSYFMHFLADLFGPNALLTDDTTASGLQQAIQTNSYAVLLDEFDAEDREAAANARVITKMLRSASRGGRRLRGTRGQEAAREFVLRHCVWLSGIQLQTVSGADPERYIRLELLPRREGDPMIQLPSSDELADLGRKCFALAMSLAIESRDLAKEIRMMKVEGISSRLLETYSSVYSILGTIYQEDLAAIENRMVRDYNQAENPVERKSDERMLLEEIFSTDLRVGTRMIPVARLVRTVWNDAKGMYPSSLCTTEEWSRADEALQDHGIRIFFPKMESSKESSILRENWSRATMAIDCLKFKRYMSSPQWEAKNIDQILMRLSDGEQPVVARMPIRICGITGRRPQIQFSYIAREFFGQSFDDISVNSSEDF